jgi:hypothetical protein
MTSRDPRHCERSDAIQARRGPRGIASALLYDRKQINRQENKEPRLTFAAGQHSVTSGELGFFASWRFNKGFRNPDALDVCDRPPGRPLVMTDGISRSVLLSTVRR